MNAHTLAVYSIVLAVLLLISGTWLASRGRKVGYFFALVGVSCLISAVVRGGAL
jgi:hypothetical protein